MTSKVTLGYMMIATFFSLLTPQEILPKQSRFRRNIRKQLNKMKKADPEKYRDFVEQANDAWNRVVNKTKNEKLHVTISDAFLAIHCLIEDEKKTKELYTERTMNEVLNSLKSNTKLSDEQEREAEVQSNRLIDLLADELNMKSDSRLKTRFHILRENAIMDRRI